MTESEFLFQAGHGFHEKIHESSLVVELGLNNIPVIQPRRPSAFTCAHLRLTPCLGREQLPQMIDKGDDSNTT